MSCMQLKTLLARMFFFAVVEGRVGAHIKLLVMPKPGLTQSA